MDFSSGASGSVAGKSYNSAQHGTGVATGHHHQHAGGSVQQQQHLASGNSPPLQQQQLGSNNPIKAESEPAMMTAATTTNSPLTGFGVSAAGVNLSVNIGVNITGVTPEAAAAAAPWATAAAYTSR